MIPDLPEAAEEDGSCECIASLAFLETCVNAAPEVDALQPREDKQGSLDTSEFAQGHGQAILARVAHLLGFRFAPRIRDLSDTKLYLPPGRVKYQALKAMTGGTINLKAIRAHWNEILRLASSLRQGSVTASLMPRPPARRFFEDKISGRRTERPGLFKAQKALRDGDTLVVWKLHRLGRSVKHLEDLVGELHKEGVQFKSLTDSIDTATPSGRFFFHVMASLVEMERELTIQWTPAGLEAARQLGRKGGRKWQMTESKIKSAKKLLASGAT